MMNKQVQALALTVTFTIGTAQAVVIDDFNGGAQSIDAPGSDTVAYAGAIGGFRTIDMTSVGPLYATAAIVLPPGIYSHSADAMTSATSNITWDANGAGLGGMDLVEGLTNNVFSFEIISIDQGDIDLILSVEDSFGGLDSFTFSNAGVGTESVAFASFTGIDFTSIDLISLQVVGGLASDLTLDLLSTTGDRTAVPEPISLALLGIGMIGVGFSRRKAK